MLSSRHAVAKLSRISEPTSTNELTGLLRHRRALTDEERAARDRARCFVQEEVMPEIVVWERAPQSCN